MSKVKINEIESLTANGDLTITPNGTGVFEVAGEDDSGILQLNTATQANKVKIKPPSTAQDYTMVLPTTDIDLSTNKILKVDSITGSGSTAVGQLAYTDLPAQDGANLNASNVSTGTVNNARLPSPLPASTGSGFKLISTTTVPSGSPVNGITWDLDDDSLYKIISNNMYFGYSWGGSTTWAGMYIYMYRYSAPYQYAQSLSYTGYKAGSSELAQYASGESQAASSQINAYTKNIYDGVSDVSQLVIELSTAYENSWIYSKIRDRVHSGVKQSNFNELRASIDNNQSGTKQFNRIRLEPSGYYFIYSSTYSQPTEFRLYKYMES
jgi:hypothetical protein